MYKYSKQAVEKFIDASAELAFIFAWFCKSATAHSFVLETAKNSKIADCGQIMLQAGQDLLETAALPKVSEKECLAAYLAQRHVLV